jgi:hypothetical protein
MFLDYFIILSLLKLLFFKYSALTKAENRYNISCSLIKLVIFKALLKLVKVQLNGY